MEGKSKEFLFLQGLYEMHMNILNPANDIMHMNILNAANDISKLIISATVILI